MATRTASPQSNGATASILVVDDEVDILEAIESTLTAYIPDCHVMTANSGSKGLAIIKEKEVHVILTDFRMPEMDGLQFLAEARRMAPRAACVMITAYPDLDLALRALNEQHVLNFITKPVQADRLVEVVEEALRIRTDEVAKARSIATALKNAREHQAHPPSP